MNFSWSDIFVLYSIREYSRVYFSTLIDVWSQLFRARGRAESISVTNPSRNEANYTVQKGVACFLELRKLSVGRITMATENRYQRKIDHNRFLYTRSKVASGSTALDSKTVNAAFRVPESRDRMLFRVNYTVKLPRYRLGLSVSSIQWFIVQFSEYTAIFHHTVPIQTFFFFFFTAGAALE